MKTIITSLPEVPSEKPVGILTVTTIPGVYRPEKTMGAYGESRIICVDRELTFYLNKAQNKISLFDPNSWLGESFVVCDETISVIFQN